MIEHANSIEEASAQCDHESRPNLDTLFRPRSIAIVGATTNMAAIGGQPIRHLTEHGYTGAIYPVNPKYDEIAGWRCYPQLSALPETPDLVVIAVAAPWVADLVRTAGELGVANVLVFSSGFAETGGDGAAAQAGLRSAAREAGINLIGPNCQGLINITDDIPVGFGTPYGLKYRAGAVSLTSQSGAFGNSLVMALSDEGVGLRRYVSTGNEASTSTLDFFEYFITDSDTRLVAAYVEGFRDAYRLRDVAARALAQRKPIVIWKVGNTAAGANAAASHTANLAGGSTYYRAAFEQYGVIGVSDIGDMADCTRALLTQRIPAGRGTAILSISGGAGIAMTDRCVELGLDVVEFSERTERTLRESMPDFGSARNPVDLTAGSLNSPEAFARALRAILDDPAVDMLGLCLAALSGPVARAVAREVVAVTGEYDAPVLMAWNGPRELNVEAYDLLEEAGVPIYESPVRCARGLGALGEYGAAVQRYETGQIEAPCVTTVRPGAAPTEASVRTLNEFDSKNLLKQYGMPVTREAVARDREHAVELAVQIGYPVVLKLLSAAVPHKSDIGGVRVNLDDEHSVRQAYDAITLAAENNEPRIETDGILVQEMIGAGVEVILGSVNDPGFGPAIMFGTGGVLAEVMGDVAFKLAPLREHDIRDLIARTRAVRLLEGVRGAPPADVDALVECIARLSDCVVAERHRYSEIDINPLIVLPQGQGVRVVDALVRIREDTVGKT